jgi:hypothetical protein
MTSCPEGRRGTLSYVERAAVPAEAASERLVFIRLVDMRKHAPLVAALVNGAVVLLLPALVVLVFASVRSSLPARYASGAVQAQSISPFMSAIAASIFGVAITIPLAALAGWRTLVHARRWQMQQRTWQGVAEAGAAGALFVIVRVGSAALAAAIHGSGSIWVIVAIAFYAAIGGLVGLVVGLMLHVTAIAVLKMAFLR